MALPKQKTPKSKTRKRRTQAFINRLKAPELARCPRCGSLHLAHFACPDCGWYGGKQVMRENRNPQNRQL